MDFLIREFGKFNATAFSLFLLLILSVAISKVRTSFGISADIEIGFYLYIIFFWARRAEMFYVPIAIAMVGLIQDALIGTPLGGWVLIFCLFFALIHSQSRILARTPFVGVWLIFAVFSGLSYLLLLLTIGWMDNVFVDAWGLIWSGLVTIALFPIFYCLLETVFPPPQDRFLVS
ncbi:rod shape-determining protein MreD [Alphaproteobacteria bacterium]|nr:rod shape-determining protein MreD [Alphaproteobacteria bacterium]